MNDLEKKIARIEFELQLRKEYLLNAYTSFQDREEILKRVMFWYDNENIPIYALPSDKDDPRYFTNAFRAAKYAVENKNVRIVLECTFLNEKKNVNVSYV